MPVIKAGVFDLDYVDVGSGPTVVLVHSSASGHRQWFKLSESLKDRYRVIAINLFGYGKTSPWSGARALSAADQAELVLAAAALSPQPVALVGHSLGGAVAFEAAAKLPGHIRALVAFEPILFGHLKAHGPVSVFDEIAKVADRFGEFARAGDWNTAGEWFVDYWGGSGVWVQMPEERRRNVTAMLPPVLHEWDMAMGVRSLDGWNAITAPVHLVHAADTRAPTREIVKLLGKYYPRWRSHEVFSGGHMAPVTRPDLVNPLIAAIIDEAFRPAAYSAAASAPI